MSRKSWGSCYIYFIHNWKQRDKTWCLALFLKFFSQGLSPKGWYQMWLVFPPQLTQSENSLARYLVYVTLDPIKLAWRLSIARLLQTTQNEKLKIELTHDQVILLQAVSPQKTENGIWNSMFVSLVFLMLRCGLRPLRQLKGLPVVTGQWKCGIIRQWHIV